MVNGLVLAGLAYPASHRALPPRLWAAVFIYPTTMDATNPAGTDSDFGAYLPAVQENIPTRNYPPSPNKNQLCGYGDM